MLPDINQVSMAYKYFQQYAGAYHYLLRDTRYRDVHPENGFINCKVREGGLISAHSLLPSYCCQCKASSDTYRPKGSIYIWTKTRENTSCNTNTSCKINYRIYKEALSNPIANVKGIRNSNKFDYTRAICYKGRRTVIKKRMSILCTCSPVYIFVTEKMLTLFVYINITYGKRQIIKATTIRFIQISRHLCELDMVTLQLLFHNHNQ